MANVWTPPGPNQNLFDPNADPFNQGGTVSGIPLPGQNPGQNPNPTAPGATPQSPFTAVDPNWQPPKGTAPISVAPGTQFTNGGPSPLPTGANFDGSLTAVQAALTGAGWGNEDPNYWVKRIAETGGATPDNLAYWKSRIAAGPQGGQPGGAYYDPGGAAKSGGPANTDPNAAVQNAPFLKAYQDALLKQLGNLTDPTQNGVNDPNLKPALDANHLATQRGLADTNTGLAEQAYGNGTLHDGTFGVAKQRAAEDASANEANFTGGAVLDNQKLRQQALMNLLGVGNTQTGLALSQQQGGDQLGYNYAALQAYLNDQTVKTITGGA